jgi:hypothetical protein
LPETNKQKLRRLLDRLTIDDVKKRELDQAIEEADESDAEMLVAFLDDIEANEPGAIERGIRQINTDGFPDDDG